MTSRPLIVALSLLAITLTACAPVDRAAAGPDGGARPSMAAHDPAWDSDPALCARASGAIRRVGLMNMPYCVIPMPDAGKVCTDRSDCTGMCIQFDTTKAGTRTTGVCQRENVQFGCFSQVEGGKAGPALCAD